MTSSTVNCLPRVRWWVSFNHDNICLTVLVASFHYQCAACSGEKRSNISLFCCLFPFLHMDNDHISSCRVQLSSYDFSFSQRRYDIFTFKYSYVSFPFLWVTVSTVISEISFLTNSCSFPMLSGWTVFLLFGSISMYSGLHQTRFRIGRFSFDLAFESNQSVSKPPGAHRGVSKS